MRILGLDYRRRQITLLALISCLVGTGTLTAIEPYCQQNSAVFCNDFEAHSWEGMEHEDDATLVTAGVPGVHTFQGSGSVEAVLDGDATGASFGYRFFGEERIYVRFYMKWDGAWDRPMHHFFAIHGDQVADPWSCHGTAGCRPNGLKCLNGATVDSRETVADELPGEPFFYSYFPDMSCDPGYVCDRYNDADAVCQGCASRGLPCNNGPECCWGNHFNLNQGVPVSMEQNRWYSVETMIRANTVFLGAGNYDGEMALWIDGEMVAHHTGVLWRHTEELLLNHFIVWNYFPQATQAYSIWFDNVVISKAYIGAFGEMVFQDGFETGDTTAWSGSVP